jgi:Rod binding domain-containing protein
MTFATSMPPGLTQATPDATREGDAWRAARQFEGLFLQQLVSTLRATTRMFEGTGGEIYGDMFDRELGDALAAAGGVGLAEVLASAMGASGEASPSAFVAPMRPSVSHAAVVQSGAPLVGATGALQEAAASLLSSPDDAARWGREGALTRGDLVSPLLEPGAAASGAVSTARAFQGYYKCNLFAFELARRAGFEVPTWGSGDRWGYPGTDAVTADAMDGTLRGGWGGVVGPATAAELDEAIVRGRSAFLLTGSGSDGRHGHMGIIERVRTIERDEHGEIVRITFDGWEARSGGAMHLTERTWTTVGHGVEGARRGLSHIAIVELVPRPPSP